jgi:GTPase SAR1 family protein
MKIDEIKSKYPLKIQKLKFHSSQKIKGLNPTLDHYGYSILIIGKPGSGKTSLILSLLGKEMKGNYYKKFDKIYVFSPSLCGTSNLINNPFDKLPKKQRHTNLKKLPDVLEELKASKKKKFTLMIFDDVQGEICEYKNEILEIVNNRRHLFISCIFTSQVYNQLIPGVRKTASSIILYSTKNKMEIETIHKETMSHLTTKEVNVLLKYVYSSKHDFLMIKPYNEYDKMFYKNFNRLVLE